MTEKLMDCGKFPSESGCRLRIAGPEDEVLTAAAAHAVAAHGHEDTPELHAGLAGMLDDVEEPGFVQVLEFRAADIDAIDALEREWAAATEGTRRTIRSLVCADRNEAGRYVVLVEFPSVEAAEANSALPATGHFAEQLGKAVEEGPSFRDLDVLHRGV